MFLVQLLQMKMENVLAVSVFTSFMSIDLLDILLFMTQNDSFERILKHKIEIFFWIDDG